MRAKTLLAISGDIEKDTTNFIDIKLAIVIKERGNLRVL